jgi:DNA-3-methyladenine glycosylase
MSEMLRPGFDWLDLPVERAARRLLGCELHRELDGRTLIARIVETEAYDQDDEASHAFRGRTARTDAMFRSAGHLYVYLIHGIHHCCNVVTGRDGYGSGALVRAAEPIEGEDVMRARRGRGGPALTNGPGKLCQALGITRTLSGHDLSLPPVRLVERDPVDADRIVTTTRIGISRAAAAPRRFYLAGNPYVSQP